MKIVVFGEARRVGALIGDAVLDLSAADGRLPATLAEFIAGGPAVVDRAAAAVDSAAAGRSRGPLLEVASTVLYPPAVPRPRIACAAGNYAAHTAGSARRKGVDAMSALAGIGAPDAVPSEEQIRTATRERAEPRGFWKDFALPKGNGDDIVIPARAERFDYEGELAVVVAGPATDVPAGRGSSYFWGVTLLNDWSIRGASRKDSHTFNLGKNFDGGASLGPCIVIDELDPGDVVVETRVNGELRQQYNSGDMIFSHAEYLEYLSRDFTFRPGDLISGGSGPGTATDSGTAFLAPGDVVEVSSPGIGVLCNQLVAKEARR